MEQWIFLLVLASLGVYLLYLLRQASKHQGTTLRRNASVKQDETTVFNPITRLPLPEPPPLKPASVSKEIATLGVKPLAITPSPPTLPSPTAVRRQSKKKPRKK